MNKFQIYLAKIKGFSFGVMLSVVFLGAFTAIFAATGSIGSLFQQITGTENGSSVTNVYRLDGANILDGTVTSYEIQDYTIRSVDIQTGAIQSQHIVTGAVTTESILDGTIQEEDLGFTVAG